METMKEPTQSVVKNIGYWKRQNNGNGMPCKHWPNIEVDGSLRGVVGIQRVDGPLVPWYALCEIQHDVQRTIKKEQIRGPDYIALCHLKEQK